MRYELLSYDLSGTFVYAEVNIIDENDNLVAKQVFGIDISDLLDSVNTVLDNAGVADKNAALWNLYIAMSDWLDSKKVS
jgi:hypothetical protein